MEDFTNQISNDLIISNDVCLSKTDIDEDYIFYVYALLDTRKRRKCKYGEFEFDYEPFYIGKGYGERCYSHLKEAYKLIGKNDEITKNSNPLKIRILHKLFDYEGFVPVIKIKENLTEQEAFDLEEKAIKTIGRRDLGNGPLANLDPGGRGKVGKKYCKNKISIKGKVWIRNEIEKVNKCVEKQEIEKYFKMGWIYLPRRPMTEDEKQKNRERQRIAQNKPEVAQKKSVKMEEFWDTDEGKQKIQGGIEKKRKNGKIFNNSSVGLKKYYENEENRQKNIDRQKQVYIDHPEKREEASIRRKKQIKEHPEIVEKQIKSLNEYYKNEENIKLASEAAKLGLARKRERLAAEKAKTLSNN